MNRRLALAVFGTAFLACAVPWWVRNALLMHNPFFSLDRYVSFFNTTAYPEWTVLREVANPGSPYLFLLKHPRHFIQLAGTHITGLSLELPAQLGCVVLPFAVGAFLARPSSRGEYSLRRGALTGLLLLSLWTLNNPFSMTTYLALVPVLVILAALLFCRLIASQSRWRKALAWSVAVVISVAPIGAKRLTREAQTPSTLVGSLSEIATNAPEAMVLITDVPTEAAWYANRTSVSLPARQNDLDAVVSAAQGRPVGFFLSQRLLFTPVSPDLRPYQRMLRSRELAEGLVEIPLEIPGGRLFIFGKAGDNAE